MSEERGPILPGPHRFLDGTPYLRRREVGEEKIRIKRNL